jgi:type IV pilus assembly protein PilA
MKNQQGFSLIELLIVVAIIAIIAAIAVPSMLTARMAANESGAIQGCRTIGSAEVSYSAVNNQTYASLNDLVTGKFLDSRFNTGGFNGYGYAAGAVTHGPIFDGTIAGFVATPLTGGTTGRYVYGVGSDQVVRYLSNVGTGTVTPKCGTGDCAAGSAIGSASSGS